MSAVLPHSQRSRSAVSIAGDHLGSLSDGRSLEGTVRLDRHFHWQLCWLGSLFTTAFLVDKHTTGFLVFACVIRWHTCHDTEVWVCMDVRLGIISLALSRGLHMLGVVTAD